jgi:hypothetical protein
MTCAALAGVLSPFDCGQDNRVYAVPGTFGDIELKIAKGPGWHIGRPIHQHINGPLGEVDHPNDPSKIGLTRRTSDAGIG